VNILVHALIGYPGTLGKWDMVWCCCVYICLPHVWYIMWLCCGAYVVAVLTVQPLECDLSGGAVQGVLGMPSATGL
jgi:hypothetical protein